MKLISVLLSAVLFLDGCATIDPYIRDINVISIQQENEIRNMSLNNVDTMVGKIEIFIDEMNHKISQEMSRLLNGSHSQI